MSTIIQAVNALKAPRAPRVIARNKIPLILLDHGLTMSRSSYQRLVSDLIEARCLCPVTNRLYLNLEASPSAAPDEAAHWLAEGAVISLQRVLGAHGVLNNPSSYITAVVPILPGEAPPFLGQKMTPAGTFVFRGIPQHIMNAGDADDRLDQINNPFPGGIATATPEKALIDWIYLGNSARSNLTPPPAHDIDVDMLDIDRLHRLASAIGPNMLGAVRTWVDNVRHYQDNHADDYMDLMSA
jgi:hypothetical protein